MSVVVAVAPHPDDETLGVGATLARHVSQGHDVHWLIVTSLNGATQDAVLRRAVEIESVAALYRFAAVHQLGLPAARLDTVPLADIVSAVGAVFRGVEPDTVYLPFPGDAHSDHRIVFDAGAACTKWFRYPSIRRVLCYETLSETGFGLDPRTPGLSPTSYVDVTDHLATKLTALTLYAGEGGQHPFPRSCDAIRALATLRGAEAGCAAAEAFALVREVQK